MSDEDWYDQFDGGGVLLPVPQAQDRPPATEAELDAEFDAVMSFLDNLDEDQAAELDELATRARNDFDSPVEEHPPDRHARQQQKPQVEFKQVISPRSVNRIQIVKTEINMSSEPAPMAEMKHRLGSRATLIAALALATASAVTLMLTGLNVAQTLPIVATVSTTVAVLLVRLREHK